MNDLNQFIIQERESTKQVVELFLKTKILQSQSLTGTYQQMMEYIHADVTRGGKWIRPSLARLSYRLVKGTSQSVALTKATAAIEIFHRFLLVHDDIIDNDLKRHGGPTLEKVYQQHFTKQFPKISDNSYSQGMAMIAGDIIHVLAMEMLIDSGFDSRIILSASAAMNQCLEDTAAGWSLETDMKYQPLSQISKDNVNIAMDLVSARYSVIWPLRIGQVLSGKSVGDWLPALESYGLHVGLAFQIQDDILAIFGDSKVTGKPVGSDMREGKKSLLLLNTYESVGGKDKQFLENQLLRPLKDLDMDRIQDLMRSSGALEQTQTQANQHAQAAVASLEQLASIYDQDSLDRLNQFAVYLAQRDH